MCIIGTASVMRHGATRYTGVFPDLAEEGLPTLRAVAKEIAQKFPRRPIFITSPADRAIATALHVMEEYGLGWRKDEVQVEKLLGPILISDHRPLFAHLEQVAGHLKDDPLELHRTWDRFYMESGDFESGAFCESRSSAKSRFVKFLERLPTLYGAECHVVAVTHIELVGSVVHDWFGVSGDYFGPAEVVHLTFLGDGQLRAEFRSERKTLKF